MQQQDDRCFSGTSLAVEDLLAVNSRCFVVRGEHDDLLGSSSAEYASIRPQATPFAAIEGGVVTASGSEVFPLGGVVRRDRWRWAQRVHARPAPGDSNTETDKCDLLDFLCRWRNQNRGHIKARGGSGGSPSRSGSATCLHNATSSGKPEFQIRLFTYHCAVSRWLRVYAGMNRPLPATAPSAWRGSQL